MSLRGRELQCSTTKEREGRRDAHEHLGRVGDAVTVNLRRREQESRKDYCRQKSVKMKPVTSWCWLNGLPFAVTLGFVILAPFWGVAAQDAASVTGGVFTPDQADRGRRQFQISCDSCHTVAEHTKQNFESKWSGQTVGDMFDLISNTMPENDPGSLKPEEYASVVAFFLSESGYPGGAKELPTDLESLKKIRIEPITK